jgi:hypothetical protein
MSFAIRDLSVLAYANGFTLWHYKPAGDALADVAADNFFADASDMMAAGDMIIVSGAAGGRLLCVAVADVGEVLCARAA